MKISNKRLQLLHKLIRMINRSCLQSAFFCCKTLGEILHNIKIGRKEKEESPRKFHSHRVSFGPSQSKY